jgi:pyrimidine deaminase RibD-like protein
MATVPTREEIAREILAIFVDHFNRRAGEVLRVNNFLGVWDARRLRAVDFKPGMELAAERGWVEVLRGGTSFRLTSDGFAAAESRQSINEISKSHQCPQALSDRDLMLRSIELARKCKSEPGKVSPKVGAVIARAGSIIGEAFRGEIEPGEHAEFTLLERKLAEETLAGATLYVTLEPCTSRNDPKIACAERIIERRIGKVFIGVLDPNEIIRGTGELRLRDAGVQIARFDSDLMPIVEELNREFSRQHRASSRPERTTATRTSGAEWPSHRIHTRG